MILNKHFWKGALVGIAPFLLLIIAIQLIPSSRFKNANSQPSASSTSPSAVIDPEVITPSAGVDLPVVWGNLGQMLVKMGVIDRTRFLALYNQRNGLDEYEKQLLDGTDNKTIRMTPQNAGFVLNLLWAFGLSNKNAVLDNGPMVDTGHDGAKNFASTGGWSLARGQGMDHYSKYEFIKLNADQHAWSNADPRQILSKEYSSASGYGTILGQIQPVQGKGGSSCGA